MSLCSDLLKQHTKLDIFLLTFFSIKPAAIPKEHAAQVQDLVLSPVSVLPNTVKKKCPVEASTMGFSQPPWCSLPMAVMPICLETMAQRMTCQRRMGRAMSCGLVAERGYGGAPPEREWTILSTWPEISRKGTL